MKISRRTVLAASAPFIGRASAATRTVEARGNSLNLSFAPHSYTQLRARLA
jgi:hypothetical protein